MPSTICLIRETKEHTPVAGDPPPPEPGDVPLDPPAPPVLFCGGFAPVLLVWLKGGVT